MYWFVGLGGKNENGEQLFKIEDDTDGVVEEFTDDDIEWYVRHGHFIKYYEGAIEENGKYMGKRFKTDCFDVIPLCKVRKGSGSIFCFLDGLGIIVRRKSTAINKSTKLHSYIKDCFTQLWINNQGDRYKVLYAKGSHDINIEFIDYKTTNWVLYKDMKDGGVADGLVYHFGIPDIDREHYLYQIWFEIISRCKNPKDERYYYYGARGIDVDESFRRASDFVKWYESQLNYKVLVDAEISINIDKDLSGKKLYGKDTCYLLPQSINGGFLVTNRHKDNTPKFCNINGNRLVVYYCTRGSRTYVKDFECDTTHSDEYYYDLMMQFFNSRNIKPRWDYDYLVKIGRKWVTAKNYFEKFWYKEFKEELEKGWITQEIYDLLLPMVECHITD